MSAGSCATSGTSRLISPSRAAPPADPHNADRRFVRTRLRTEVLPLMFDDEAAQTETAQEAALLLDADDRLDAQGAYRQGCQL